MNRLRTSEIARRLAERDDVEPPEGLLEKIKGEIPPALSVAPEIAAKLPAQERAPQRRPWLIAASVAAAVCGGVLALQVMERMPSDEMAYEAEEAPSPEVPPESRAVPQAPAPAQPSVEEKDAAADESLGVEEPGARADESLRLRREAPKPERKVEGGVVGGAVGGTVKDEFASKYRVDGVVITEMAAPGAKPQLYDFDSFEEMETTTVTPPPPPAAEPAPPPPAPAPEPPPPAQVEDTITVLGESPLLDERRISTGSAVSQKELEKVPTARDPWAKLQKTPGVLTDRINVGGNESSQRQFYEGPSAASNTAQTRVLFTETQVDRLSTFSLDVDTASYTVVRNYLRSGQLPPPPVVRVEEVVNFFSYGDPAPTRGAFAIRAEGAPSPFAPGPEYRLLRFNLRAREVRPENRRPAVLTLVIDISNSMNEDNRLGLVKKAIPLLLEQMRPQDKVGVVVYGNIARVVLEPTADREAVRRAAEGLVPEGSTNVEQGLVLGYAMATRHFRPGGINRVVLCSDGVANVGRTTAEGILERIGGAAKGGIELTTLGFGMGEYNDTFMEHLADKGNGRYAYVDTLDEARRVLVDEITGSLLTVARDAKAQVDFNPSTVERWRLIGYENRLIPDRRFRDNSIDAGEIGAGHSVTALYEVKLKPGARPEQRIATFQLRFREPDMGALQETARELRVSDLAPSWEKASPGLRFASVVAELAEILKQSPEAADGNLKRVLRRLNQVAPAFEKSSRAADVADLVKLVRTAVRLQGVR